MNTKDLDKLERESEFDYMMLDRLKSDLEYYWNNGNQCKSYLYYGDYKKHMKEVISIWKKLPKKPDWFRASEIRAYKYRYLSTQK